MNVYTSISKRIGWNNSASIPTIREAIILRNKVMLNSCENSFEQVFKIHRFAPNANTDDECIAMSEIYNAFIAGREIFRD